MKKETLDRLEEIRERVSHAQPGPWVRGDDLHVAEPISHDKLPAGRVYVDVEASMKRQGREATFTQGKMPAFVEVASCYKSFDGKVHEDGTIDAPFIVVGNSDASFIAHSKDDVEFLLNLITQLTGTSQQVDENNVWVAPEESVPMKPIEGLDLQTAAQEVIKEEAEKAKGPIKDKVRSIVVNLVNWKKELEQKEKEVLKLKEKIAKADKKKADLLSSDPEVAWKALEEDKNQNQQGNKQGGSQGAEDKDE